MTSGLKSGCENENAARWLVSGSGWLSASIAKFASVNRRCDSSEPNTYTGMSPRCQPSLKSTRGHQAAVASWTRHGRFLLAGAGRAHRRVAGPRGGDRLGERQRFLGGRGTGKDRGQHEHDRNGAKHLASKDAAVRRKVTESGTMASARKGRTSRVTNRPALHLDPQPAAAGIAADDYPGLVRAASGGDEAAMERLLMRAQEVAWRFSTLVCGHTEDAEDAMQEALVTTYKRASSIRHPEAFRAWLYRTVRNACLMRRRTRVDEPKRMLSLDELLPTPDGARSIDPPAPTRSPEDLAINARLRTRMNKAIAALPPAYRAVVFLRDMEGLSTREVAEVVGTSEDNVKQRLHRARLFLRKELETR